MTTKSLPFKQDIKVRNGEGTMWSQGLTHSVETGKDFATAKPLISILDLGKLLLQYARDGDEAKVHELLIKGAPFNTDWLGMTPLHYAAKHNSYEICDMLLRGGINKDAKTKVDRTALHFAVYEGNQEVVELLLSRNADVNIKDMLRMTALHWAIEKQHMAIAKLLIRHGADASILSKFDKTPISIAVQTGQTDLLHELETAQLNQRNKTVMDTQENQTETNDAVNSIKLDVLNTPKFDLTSLVDDDEMLKGHSVESPNRSINKFSNSSRKSSPVINNDIEEMDYVEPIVNLLDDTKHMDESALEILKHHGITMLPTDDPQNLLSSALEDGRKLVLSEAGKLVLKEANESSSITGTKLSPSLNVLRRIPNNQFSHLNKNPNKKNSIVLRTKAGTSIKSNKNVKIITMDMFKQLYGGNLGNPLKKIIKPNLSKPPNQPKFAKLIKLNNMGNKKPSIEKICLQEFREQTQHAVKSLKSEMNVSYHDDLPPNIIEVCSESDPDEDPADGNMFPSPVKDHSPSRPALKCPQPVTTPQTQSEVPILDIPEICRQLRNLQNQTETLRRDLEQAQKQNEEYRIRLECLERKDRDVL